MPRNGKRNGLKGLTILDFSDRELLLIVMEEAEADSDGYCDTQAITDRLVLDVKHPNNSVGVRMGYLRRIGAVEKDPEHDSSTGQTRWTVTPQGRLLAAGQIRAAAQRQLDSMGTESMVLLARFIGRRTVDAETQTARKMIQREWRHTTGR